MSNQTRKKPADAIKEAKDNMDESIAKAMQEFTQRTGMEVKHIEVTLVLAGMEVVDYHVSSEVALFYGA